MHLFALAAATAIALVPVAVNAVDLAPPPPVVGLPEYGAAPPPTIAPPPFIVAPGAATPPRYSAAPLPPPVVGAPQYGMRRAFLVTLNQKF